MEDSDKIKLSSTAVLALKIFQDLNRAESQSDAIDSILREIKKHVGVSATAIRIRKGNDFPYYFYDGFHEAHIETESSLCKLTEDGNPVVDSSGEPLLSCLCGRVLQGKTDPSQPFFTTGGSFWTNNTDRLLEVTQPEYLGETRNVCNAEGYMSVALIPLKSIKGVIGLLQLNDEKPDRFTPELIEFLEGLGESIGIALARLDEEKQRTALQSEREKLLHRYQLRIKELDCLYKIGKLQENQDLTTEETLDLIVGLLPGSLQYPDIAVAGLTIEDEVFSSPGYRPAPRRYSALVQSYGVVVGKLEIGYLEEKAEEFRGPFLEEEVKLVNLVAETISRMLERKKSGDWRRELNRYALILNEEEMRHITKLVLEDMAIGEMDREEYNIKDVPEDSTQSIESYMTLQFNLELNRNLIMKLQNLLSADETI